MAITQTSFSSPYSAEQAAIERQRKLAEALQAQSMQPIEQQTAGGWVVPTSPLQGLAKVFQGYVSGQSQRAADEKERALGSQRNAAITAALSSMPKARQESVYGVDDGSGWALPDQQRTVNPTVQEYSGWLGKLAQIDPRAVQIGSSMVNMQQRADENDEARAFRGQQATEARQARQQEIEARLADSRTSREEAAELRRELAEAQRTTQRAIADQADATRRELPSIIAANRPPPAQRAPEALESVLGPEGKPVLVPRSEAIGKTPASSRDGGRALPASALRMQQEELDAIGTAGSINADLSSITKQLEDGKLYLGPVNNLTAKARNFTGMSNESSRNLASFESTLERLRNDSLRLNKGVQTEGDSQRAWNELVTNINDPKVVKQRLEEIQKTNERAVKIRRMNIDAIRNNFNAPPLDSTEYGNQRPAVGASGGWGGKDRRATPSARVVVDF